MPRGARESQCAGTFLAMIVFVKIPFRSRGSILSEFNFLTDPPVFVKILYIVNRHGNIDKRSINGVDETIDSKGNIAKICAGG
jgi:hypothetical protein